MSSSLSSTLSPSLTASPSALSVPEVPEPWVSVPSSGGSITLGRPEHVHEEFVSEASSPFTLSEGVRGKVEKELGLLWGLAGLGGDSSSCKLEVLVRGENHRGFVVGHIWGPWESPSRIRLQLCPNADMAEIYATLAHEVAHAVCQNSLSSEDVQAHGIEFKRALVDLVGRRWGSDSLNLDWVDVTRPYPHVDSWVAMYIRGCLEGRGLPSLHLTEGNSLEGRGAAVRRVLKMRRIAESQCGTPEGISATALANDLVASWDLFNVPGDMKVGSEDVLCDRFTFIGKRQKWKRKLAWAVGEFFGVYILSQHWDGTLHWFGRLSSLEAALDMFDVAERHIQACLAVHMRERKDKSVHPRTEGTNFRYSAVLSFWRKLRELGGSSEIACDDREAREFAKGLLAARGVKVAPESGSSWSWSDAGGVAGGTVPLGLCSEGGVKKITFSG